MDLFHCAQISRKSNCSWKRAPGSLNLLHGIRCMFQAPTQNTTHTQYSGDGHSLWEIVYEYTWSLQGKEMLQHFSCRPESHPWLLSPKLRSETTRRVQMKMNNPVFGECAILFFDQMKLEPIHVNHDIANMCVTCRNVNPKCQRNEPKFLLDRSGLHMSQFIRVGSKVFVLWQLSSGDTG